MKVCAVEDAYSLEQAEEKALADYYISHFRKFTGVSVCFIHQIPSRRSANIHAGDTQPVARGNKLAAMAQDRSKNVSYRILPITKKEMEERGVFTAGFLSMS